MVLWKRLTHKNVLPFLGISTDFAEFCLISPWMKNGTIMEYVRDHSQANPLELVRTIFLRRTPSFPTQSDLAL